MNGLCPHNNPLNVCQACAAEADGPSGPVPGSVHWFSQVYSVLMVHCEAPLGMMQQFIAAHTGERPCDEFRFQGRLGFGGKYRRKTNTVDYYPEDETHARRALMHDTNAALAALNGAG